MVLMSARMQITFAEDEIMKYREKQCPFNQMTVMFRKEIVRKVVGYLDGYFGKLTMEGIGNEKEI